MSTYRRDALLIGLLALAVGTVMALLIRNPGYTDAFYYFNAGQRLVQGKGLTDAALWTYIGAPPGLPVPSHLYWMPLTSFVAAAGMAVGGPNFDSAQLFFVPLYAALVIAGFGLGAALGKSRRVAWLAGLLTLFSGFFMPYWTTTATFGPFGVAGALALVAMGLGRRSGDWRWFAASGALCGLAHLARNDAPLLVLALIAVALWPGLRGGAAKRVLAGLFAYFLVMAPWFARNLSISGTILPAGGLETAWMRSYDELVNYPPGVDMLDFVAWGVGNVIQSRWEALLQNLQRFVAEQGMIVMTPLMLIGLWRRRRDPLLSGFVLYAPGLFALMTFVFTFPGTRGGLFHSAAALVPFWAALGVCGLDDVIDWAAPRRRWRVNEARLFFGGALLVWAVYLSATAFWGKAAPWSDDGSYFRRLNLPPNAIVMINDPSAMYYFTGISGVVVPNAPPETISDLAARYGVTHVILDANRTEPMAELWERRRVPFFLEHFYYDGTIRIFKVRQNADTDPSQ